MAEYIDYTQANTLFSDVDARFDTVEGKIPSNASSGNKMVTASDIATKADLVDGKVPSSQLPSYVDDVLEYASTSQFPATGESGKIYVALDTNKTYRWGGSDYVEISESLALGETSSTAYAGDKGKANADAISDIQDLIPSGATTSNKLATASDIPDTSGLQPKTLATTIGSYTTVEGALSGINDGKVDKVTGKGLSTNDYDATAKGKVDGMDASIAASQNASTALLKDTVGWTGKNLLDNITKTTTDSGAYAGVSYVYNPEDGSIKLNGTASSNNTSYVFMQVTLPKGTYVLSKSGRTDGYVQICDYPITQELYSAKTSDVEFTLNTDTPVIFRFRLLSGAVFNNDVFYPMLRDASITDSTYEPYHASVEEVIRQNNNTSGVTNWFNYRKIVGGANIATVSAKGDSIEIKNPSTGTWMSTNFESHVKPNTDYVLTVDVAYTSGKGCISIRDSSGVTILAENNSILENGHIELSFNSSNHNTILIKLFCTGSTSELGDVTYNNLMIKLATNPETSFQDFAKSNKELTDGEFVSDLLLSSAVDLDNIKDTGMYCVTSQPTHCPFSYGTLIVEHIGASVARQIGIKINKASAGAIYIRSFSDNSWGNWYYTSIGNVVS